MRVAVLGAGTTIPAKGYSPAGLYVQVGKEHLLLDAGPGTLQRLHSFGIAFVDIDRVFLTHYHLDHCLDLATLLFANRIPQPPRSKPLSVYGPSGLRRLYHRLNSAFQGWIEPKGYRLRLTEWGEGHRRFGQYAIATRPMNHSTQALGYRLSAHGKAIAYSGDTDACEAIVALGHKADLLILECSMPDERKIPGHLTPTECGRIAKAALCKRLVLTHFYPVFQGYDIRRRVRRSFRGALSLARDGSTFDL